MFSVVFICCIAATFILSSYLLRASNSTASNWGQNFKDPDPNAHTEYRLVSPQNFRKLGGDADEWRRKNDISEAVCVILRFYQGNMPATAAMVGQLVAQQLSPENRLGIVVILLPTDYVPFETLEKLYTLSQAIVSQEEGCRVLIAAHYPSPELHELLADSTKKLDGYQESGNVYKHYVFTDATITWALNYCSFCKYMLVTNGDNLYDGSFIQQCTEVLRTGMDVVMVNFVHKSKHLFQAAMRCGRNDLGAAMYRRQVFEDPDTRYVPVALAATYVGTSNYHSEYWRVYQADCHMLQHVIQNKKGQWKIIQDKWMMMHP